MSEPHAAYNLDLFESPPAVVSRAPGGYRALALAELARNPEDYPTEFVAWLQVNWRLWTAFCRIADNVRSAGNSNYSARAVFHILRYETLMREQAVTSGRTPQFKLNNVWSPSMARLYNAMSPLHEGFFFTRESGT